MNELQLHTLPEKKLLLLNTPKSYLRNVMPQIIARLSLRGSLFVIDAGNAIRPYVIAREIRRLTEDVNPHLENIKLSRVFTCYQVLTRLETLTNPRMPVLLLDLLDMFYDEHTSSHERERLLIKSLDCLKQISLEVAVAVSCGHARNEHYPEWIAIVRQFSDEIIHWEEPPVPQNYRFF